MLDIRVVKVMGKRRLWIAYLFPFQPGDIYGFIGANGAGKTTTIKAVIRYP